MNPDLREAFIFIYAFGELLIRSLYVQLKLSIFYSYALQQCLKFLKTQSNASESSRMKHEQHSCCRQASTHDTNTTQIFISCLYTHWNVNIRILYKIRPIQDRDLTFQCVRGSGLDYLVEISLIFNISGQLHDII